MIKKLLSTVGYFIVSFFLRILVFLTNTFFKLSRKLKKKNKPMSIYQQDKEFRESIFSQNEQ
jgi:hypothetical protein